MHFDFIAEGVKEELDEFEKWWSTRTFPMVIKDKEGKEINGFVQGGLRPRRAYTLVFPKDSLQQVINTMNPSDCEVGRYNKKGSKILQTPLKIIRKFLRLKKLPKVDLSKGIIPMRNFKNVRVIGLGTRDDIDITHKDGTTHEAL